MQIRSRWSAIVGYSLVGAATQLVWLNFAGVTTVAAARYGVSESAIGWLAQVFPLLYVVLAIPCGLVLDRWFRAGLVAGAVLTAVGAVVRLIGDDFGWLLAGQILASIAQPLVLNAVTGITGRYLREKDRPTGIAIGTASIFAGMVIAFLLSAIFTTAASLPAMLIAAAAFCVLAAVVLVVALYTSPTHSAAAREANDARAGENLPPDVGVPPRSGVEHEPGVPSGVGVPLAVGAAAAGRRDRGALAAAWGDPLIRRLCVLAIFPFGVFVAMSTFAQALLEPAGVSGATASTILLLQVVAGVIGSATIPILVVRRHSESLLLVVSLATTAAACTLLAIAPSAATGFLSITVIGLLLLPALPIVLELVERRTGEAEGTAAGLIWMAGNLGGLVVAVAVGLLVHHPTAAFLLMAAIALLAVPGARALHRPITELRP
ncbi:putative MFS family arabinose efflux permease [Kribbella aluminosa]|uniref:MFS family arabinose efflux permease n=1 Tax=Kribbella aluminosa TaxID=416017 RepID=A0ABS4UTF5_9ACTN|nr:MFS transporter [Kribbella aluminosa]MBP2354919.1 putative MFS family arabinose efflux permease [Kribbella aluminosa]